MINSPLGTLRFERDGSEIMLFAFNASMAMLISILSTFATGILAIIKSRDFGIPIPLGIALIIMSAIGMMILLSSVPKLYNETVKRCNDDIEGFAKEQRSIAKRCTGKVRMKVKMNLIFGLLAYDRLEEAESLLTGMIPSVEKSGDVLYELDCLLYRLEIARKRHDDENGNYIAEKLLEKIRNDPELSPLERVEYETLTKIRQLETAFFDTSGVLSEAEKRDIAKQLNFYAGVYLAQEHMGEMWYDYFYTHFNYVLGVTYAALDDERSTEFYLGIAASQPFTYPEVMQARQYAVKSQYE